jgi:trehalose synthase
MMDLVTMTEVDVPPLPVERFEPVIGAEALAELRGVATTGHELLAGRTLWCVNSTARGGGVAELLVPLLGYVRGAGISARWIVLEGDPDFFAVTKRLHHRLHGLPGDGGPLGPREREIYERTTARNAEDLRALVAAGDVVLLHDPQTAGLAPAAKATGAHVVWRLHVGADHPNDLAREAWSFLAGDLEGLEGYVVSRGAYAWPQMPEERVHVIEPSIDPLSPKNQDLPDELVRSILQRAGLLEGAPRSATEVASDGTVIRVQRRATILEDRPVPRDAPVVTQISRWDPLKDPLGVLEGFVACVADLGGTHLVLAGPDVSAVADDPEAGAMLSAVRDTWHGLPDAVRERIHIVSLPMEDTAENALMVNALQRHATVVVQKSLAEGFGLTVAEAMWKSRPVVGSRVGGIQDQIVHGESGLLLDDASDRGAFADALRLLLGDPLRAAEIGHAARARVLDRFLEPRHLRDWLAITRALLATETS